MEHGMNQTKQTAAVGERKLCFQRFWRLVQAHWRVAVSRLLFLLGPFAALCAVETLNEKNPFVNLNGEEWVMNLALYIMVWTAIWLLLGRRRSTAVTGMVLFTLAGIANHYVLKYMGRVLFPNDLAGVQTAANVAKEYSFVPDRYVLGALGIAGAYLLLSLLMMPGQKKRSYFHLKWLNALAALGAAAYCYAFFFSPWLPEAGIRTQQWNTQCNGFVLNFSLALRYSRVEQPEGYSLKAVSALVDAKTETGSQGMTLYKDPRISSPYEADTQDAEDADITPVLTVTGAKDGTQPLNILCIMDESFADLSIYESMSMTADSVPFFHSLRENTIKGWMYSTVTGGGTATVEYEFLTGNTATFLPMGTVAYQLYVKDKMPSLISWANALGFHTTTFHPYEASGWNRTVVYEDFGADTQLYEEDVVHPETIRGYISDSCDFDQLKRITSAREGDKQFVFNVTMQNHGGYAQGWENLSRTPVLSGPLAGASSSTDQYLALMRATDEALEELIDYYSSVEEPTLIVFFGDHQGKLTNDFYTRLYGKEAEDRTLAETEQMYVVPFFLWANYDIDEAQDVMISTNYLGTLLAQVSNYPMTGYQKFLGELYNTLPVINRMSYITAGGTLTDTEDDLTEEELAALHEYSMLSYYNLFQRDEDLDEGFFLPETE